LNPAFTYALRTLKELWPTTSGDGTASEEVGYKKHHISRGHNSVTIDIPCRKRRWRQTVSEKIIDHIDDIPAFYSAIVVDVSPMIENVNQNGILDHSINWITRLIGLGG
jgi:hypothetical protein